MENSLSSSSSRSRRLWRSGSAISSTARMLSSTDRPRKIDDFLRQIADPQPRAAIHRQRGHILAVDQHLPAFGRHQPGNGIKAGGLARPVRPQQRHHLAPVQVHADIADHRPLLVAFAQGCEPAARAAPSVTVSSG